MQKITTKVDFPKQGITFRDVTGILQDIDATRELLEKWSKLLDNTDFDVVAGMESRGLHFGMLIANHYNKPFISIRKPGKIPNPVQIEYKKEYGTDKIELSKDYDLKGKRVIIVDDIFATGGTRDDDFALQSSSSTAKAVFTLLELVGAIPMCITVVLQIHFDEPLDPFFDSYNLKSVYKVQNHSTNIIDDNYEIKSCGRQFRQPDPYFVPCLGNTVFYHDTMKDLAMSYLSENDVIAEVSFARFKDNWMNITFDYQIEDKDIIFFMNMADPKYFTEQLIFLMILPRQFIKSLKIIVPYFGCGTHERVDKEGILATAEPILKLMSSIPMTKTGPAVYEIFDIHALPERFYGTDSIRVSLLSAIPLFLYEILKEYKEFKPTIAFPDDGAFKRFHNNFKGFPMIICSKMRDLDKRYLKITGRIQIPHNEALHELYYKDVIIVDDLVMSGNTLLECQRLLFKEGFKNISCFVTHAVFPDAAYEKIKVDDFKKFYITNSNPTISKILEYKEPFQVISLYKKHPWQSTINFGRVFIGSTNNDKIKAIKNYYGSRVKANIEFKTMDVPSGIPEQPFGLEEITLGALNRATRMKDYLKKTNGLYYGDTFFGIESGIIENTSQSLMNFSDITIICVLDHGCEPVFYETEEIVIPEEYKFLVQNTGLRTFGSIIEKYCGWEKGSWQFHVSGKSRSTLVTEVLCSNHKSFN
jgi:adenine phosphoribosyltransferase